MYKHIKPAYVLISYLAIIFYMTIGYKYVNSANLADSSKSKVDYSKVESKEPKIKQEESDGPRLLSEDDII